MVKLIKYSLAILGLFIVTSVLHAGNGKDMLKKEPESPMKKPILGLGAGTLTFYGDVYKNNYYELFGFKFGYDIGIQKQINRNLFVSGHLLYGKLYGEERSPSRNLNFQSPIINPYIGAEYALNRISKYKIRYVSPYVSLGLGLLYFHPKGDLTDANGNTYYYWQDGTIHNLPEDDQSAVVIYRDYVYETDLRKANIDSLGNYSLLTMNLPIGIGLNCKVTPKITVKLGMQYNFTFTDLIDNVNARSLGNRQGKPGFDKYIFSSVSLYYNLNDIPPDPEEFIFNGIDLLSLATEDSDGDGVTDFDDECADTPPGTGVDSHGCPFDDDYDGIPNYRDKERDTPFGAMVNVDGVQIKDEDFALLDTLPKGNIPKEMFTIQLGIFKNGVPKELLDKFLRISDLEKAVMEDSSVIYFAGRYFTEQGATQILNDSIKDSIPNAIVVKMLNGKFIPLTKPIDKIAQQKAIEDSIASAKLVHPKDSLSKIDSLSTANAIVKADSIEKIKEDTSRLVQEGKRKDAKDSLEKVIEKKDTLLSVKQVSKDTLLAAKDSNQKIIESNMDTLKSGRENSSEKIKDNKLADLNLDISVKDKNSKKITTQEDSTKTKTIQSEKTIPLNADSLASKPLITDATKPNLKGAYTIQLAEYKTAVPQDDLKKLMNVKGVQPKKSDKGETTYQVGNYKTMTEANSDLDKYKQMGFPNAKVVSTPEQQNEMLANKKEDKLLAENKNAVKDSSISELKANNSTANEKNINKSVTTNVAFNDTTSVKIPQSNSNKTIGTFAVLLGRFTKDVPQDIIDKLLSVPDITSTKIGELTYYTTKVVPTLEEAQNRLEKIKNSGFTDAQIVEFKNNKIVPLGENTLASTQQKNSKTLATDETLMEKQVDEDNNLLTNNDKDKNQSKQADVNSNNKENQLPHQAKSDTEIKVPTQIKTEGLVFRVQLGAFKNKSTNEPYLEKGVVDVISFPADGYTKYFTGAFVSYEEARDHKMSMQQMGFTDAFISAYKDGKKVEIREALNSSPHTTKPSSDKLSVSKTNEAKANKQPAIIESNVQAEQNAKLTATDIIYKVQLGSFKRVPSTILEDIQIITAEPAENGYTRLMAGHYSNYTEAKSYESKVKEKGNTQAFVVAYKNGKRISLQEAGVK